MVKGDAAISCNGSPPLAAEMDHLSCVIDFLTAIPAADAYTEDQKLACVACALRVTDPRRSCVLERLHELSLPASLKCKHSETLVRKALVLLLDPRPCTVDLLAETLSWRLAREKTWTRDHKLRALATILQSVSTDVDNLLKPALHAPRNIVISAFCILLDTNAGDSYRSAQANIAVRLNQGGLPAVVVVARLKILAVVLHCEATESAILAVLATSRWSGEVEEAIKHIANTQSGQSIDTTDAVSLDVIHCLRCEPREKQLSGLLTAIGARRESPIQEASVIKAIAHRATSLPGKTMMALLHVFFAPAETRTAGGEVSDSAFEVLVQRISTGRCELSTPELRLNAFACLFQTSSKQEAVLTRAAHRFTKGSLPLRALREVAECVLLGKATGSSEKSRENGAGLQAVLRLQDLPPDVARILTDAMSSAKASQHQTSALGGASAASEKQESLAATEPGRFGLGLLELEPLDDEEEDRSPGEVASTSAKAPVAEEEEDQAGWGALKALVEEDEGDIEEDEYEEDEEEEEEDEDDDEEASDLDVRDSRKRRRTKKQVEDDENEGEDDSELEADDLEEDEDLENGGTGDGLESGEYEDDEDEYDEVDSLGRSDSEMLESYDGSELEPLDVAEREDSDGDSGAEKQGDDGLELGKGGLSLTFGGGSLHSEEKTRRPTTVQIAPRLRRPTSIRVVFPSLIWRGKDMLVVNKPADWICSASDVDKKKGRPLDPNEKVQVKGFKVLEDLTSYKFSDREKKYIHWWIQLRHDLDEKSYPNLFDEDQNYGLCHRLDRETSGTVLVGLTQLARQQMRECFHRHYVRKLYVCLVHGIVTPTEQTVDRTLEAMGQKARLHPNGKRARTHVRVLGYYEKTKNGNTESFSLCTCEIAEGRMHQIRLHMSGALGAPIVSEFYYQKSKQMIEDRRWCQRTFLHAYAVGFPDVSGDAPRIGTKGECGLVEEEKLDTEQEWHCCICPLTEELREALQELTPKGDEASRLRETICETGLLDKAHEPVHVMGTTTRKEEIDNTFFPWSSTVNPIEAGDLSKPRDTNRTNRVNEKGRSSCATHATREGAALRPKPKPRRRNNERLRVQRGASASPRHHDRVRKRARVASRGRPRSPGPPPPPRSRSAGRSPPPGPPPPPRQGRRGRSRSRPARRRSVSRRRPPGAPPSPRRSASGPPRRKRRHTPNGQSVSPPAGRIGGVLGGSRPPPPPARVRRGNSGIGVVATAGGGLLNGGGVASVGGQAQRSGASGRRLVESPQRVVLTACR